MYLLTTKQCKVVVSLEWRNSGRLPIKEEVGPLLLLHHHHGGNAKPFGGQSLTVTSPANSNSLGTRCISNAVVKYRIEMIPLFNLYSYKSAGFYRVYNLYSYKSAGFYRVYNLYSYKSAGFYRVFNLYSYKSAGFYREFNLYSYKSAES